MFEYLMPPLFLRSYPGTLAGRKRPVEQSSTKSLMAKRQNIPWGISESGFYRFDANQNYQYRAFGTFPD